MTAARIILAFTLTTLLAPVVALILLREHTDTAMFWLTLAGWLAFFAGPILGSRFVAEPLYDVMLSWDAHQPPADWQATRARYYRINAIRTTGSLAALVLFVAALGQPTP